MIETQARADVPIPEMNLILYVSRRFDIPPSSREIKLLLRTRIELANVRNCIMKVFVHRAEQRVNAHFPVMSVVVSGEITADVSFAKTAVLENDNGCRCGIG